MNKVELGKFVKKLRNEENQVSFCKKLGISQPRLSKIENGKLELTLGVAVKMYEAGLTSADEIMKNMSKATKAPSAKKGAKNVSKS